MSAVATAWSYLALAIFAEIVGTSALKASAGFSRLAPSVLAVVAYGAAFYCLALALRSLPVGVAYAIWSGVGVVGIALIGWLVFGQRLDAWGVLGIGLILAGVLVLQLLSRAGG